MQQALVPAVPIDPRRRTTVSFQLQGDPWPVIAAWGQQHKFLPRQPQTGNVKLFQKGSGLWTAPMRAQFTVQGEWLQLQAWVHIPLLSRIMALLMLPGEMNLASGGLRAVLPRSLARKAVNDLLGRFGAPLIT